LRNVWYGREQGGEKRKKKVAGWDAVLSWKGGGESDRKEKIPRKGGGEGQGSAGGERPQCRAGGIDEFLRGSPQGGKGGDDQGGVVSVSTGNGKKSKRKEGWPSKGGDLKIKVSNSIKKGMKKGLQGLGGKTQGGKKKNK